MPYSLDQAYDYLVESSARRRLAHAYLITGSDAAKTEALAARMLGMVQHRTVPESLDDAVGNDMHLVRPRSKSQRIVAEDIKDMQHYMSLRGGLNAVKLGIIADADRMMESAANKFLKLLEEPPDRAMFLLLSTRPEQLLPTILSRCIEVPLIRTDGIEVKAGSPEAALLDSLSRHGLLADKGIDAALALARAFIGILAESRTATEKLLKKEYDEEVARYKKSTDSAGWLDGREEIMEAQVKAEGRLLRRRLVGVAISWFGDAIRKALDAGHPDLPGYAAATSKLAAADGVAGLLKRMEAMEYLRDLFETNVTEDLAIEVCFLRAFSKRKNRA